MALKSLFYEHSLLLFLRASPLGGTLRTGGGACGEQEQSEATLLWNEFFSPLEMHHTAAGRKPEGKWARRSEKTHSQIDPRDRLVAGGERNFIYF